RRGLGTDQGGHDQRVDGDTAVGHPTERVEEVVDVEDAVLEQVAETGGTAPQQLDGPGGLDVLAEQQQGRGVAPAADLDGGPDALVGVGGRHADVDDGHVGRLP